MEVGEVDGTDLGGAAGEVVGEMPASIVQNPRSQQHFKACTLRGEEEVLLNAAASFCFVR